VCDLETSRIGAPYIYIYIYIYDISSLRVNSTKARTRYILLAYSEDETVRTPVLLNA